GGLWVEVLEQVARVLGEQADRAGLDLRHVGIALPDAELSLHGVARALERLGVDLRDDLVRVVRLGADDDRVGRARVLRTAGGILERVVVRAAGERERRGERRAEDESAAGGACVEHGAPLDGFSSMLSRG